MPDGSSTSSSRDTTEVVVRRELRPRPDEDPQPAVSGKRHTLDEYEAAKSEPVVLAPQLGVQWKAPALRLAGPQRARPDPLPGRQPVDACEKIDTGGYHVTTTLDMEDAGHDREVALRRGPGPEPQGHRHATLKNLKIPTKDWGWLQNLQRQEHPQRRRRRHRLPDRRRSSPTSARPATPRPATKKFQPQFDVLSDGWRQPGSSIKPINYAIGIEDQTMTAATMFMDVTTDFGGELHRRPRPTSSSAARSASARRSSSR